VAFCFATGVTLPIRAGEIRLGLVCHRTRAGLTLIHNSPENDPGWPKFRHRRPMFSRLPPPQALVSPLDRGLLEGGSFRPRTVGVGDTAIHPREVDLATHRPQGCDSSALFADVKSSLEGRFVAGRPKGPDKGGGRLRRLSKTPAVAGQLRPPMAAKDSHFATWYCVQTTAAL
jgi:hypothetical protein